MLSTQAGALVLKICLYYFKKAVFDFEMTGKLTWAVSSSALKHSKQFFALTKNSKTNVEYSIVFSMEAKERLRINYFLIAFLSGNISDFR